MGRRRHEQSGPVPNHGPSILHNLYCIYCGGDLSKLPSNREHVIGRKFVPTGTLQGAWNLIANVCVPCNGAKAELEDEISAVTMLPSVAGRWASDDPRFRESTLRKAKGARSRATGKPVGESHARHSVKLNFAPGVTMTIDMVGAPYVAPERFHELARLHAVALFGMMTYREQERRTQFWEGPYVAVAHAPRSDWGNERLREFVGVTASWLPRLWVNTADGFFKVMIRKRPDVTSLWSFAAEWNKSYRVLGLFGNEGEAVRIGEALPLLQMKRVDSETRVRDEVAIHPGQDTLFHRPDWDDDHRAVREVTMREFPRSTARRVGSLERGMCVITLKKRRRWMKVSRMVDPAQNPVEGWVRAKYLRVPRD